MIIELTFGQLESYFMVIGFISISNVDDFCLEECLFGRPPFSFISIDDLIYQIRSDKPIEVNDTKI